MSDQPIALRLPDVKKRLVKKVKSDDAWDEVEFDDGWSMALRTSAPVRPKVGAVIEMHMHGNMRVGYSIDGIVCEDPHPVVVHLRQALSGLKMDLEKVEAAIAGLDKANARIAALPLPLRERILRFRAANLDFVWKYEPYEMASCEEAARIASAFKTDEAIVAFSKLPYGEQKAALPSMDDGHSGNTFGFALLLARALVSEDTTLIEKCPPAIAPITGNEPHGAWFEVTPPMMEAVS